VPVAGDADRGLDGGEVQVSGWPDLTTALAVWAAVLSTCLATFKIRDHFRDRANIRVELGADMRASPTGGTEYGRRTLLHAKVINVGQRPTSITHVSVMLPRGQGYFYCMDPRANGVESGSARAALEARAATVTRRIASLGSGSTGW